MHCQARAITSISRGEKLTFLLPAMLILLFGCRYDVCQVFASAVGQKLSRESNGRAMEEKTERGGDTLFICFPTEVERRLKSAVKMAVR